MSPLPPLDIHAARFRTVILCGASALSAHESSGHTQQIAQRVEVDTRHPHEHDWIADVVIRQIVDVRVGRHQQRPLFETDANSQGVGLG